MSLCANRVNQRVSLILTLFLLHVFQHRHKGQFGLFQPVQVVNDIPHQEIFGAHRVADAVDNFIHPFQYAIQNIPARYVPVYFHDCIHLFSLSFINKYYYLR